MTCKTCAFWNAQFQQCRRFPPQVVPVQHYQYGELIWGWETIWPEPRPENLCGEYKDKK
jgi:hypothetical protein